jgi:hypothetical protein
MQPAGQKKLFYGEVGHLCLDLEAVACGGLALPRSRPSLISRRAEAACPGSNGKTGSLTTTCKCSCLPPAPATHTKPTRGMAPCVPERRKQGSINVRCNVAPRQRALWELRRRSPAARRCLVAVEQYARETSTARGSISRSQLRAIA